MVNIWYYKKTLILIQKERSNSNMKIIASKLANNFTNNDASWNRSRSLAELCAFVAAHDEALEVEDFEL